MHRWRSTKEEQKRVRKPDKKSRQKEKSTRKGKRNRLTNHCPPCFSPFNPTGKRKRNSSQNHPFMRLCCLVLQIRRREDKGENEFFGVRREDIGQEEWTTIKLSCDFVDDYHVKSYCSLPVILLLVLVWMLALDTTRNSFRWLQKNRGEEERRESHNRTKNFLQLLNQPSKRVLVERTEWASHNSLTKKAWWGAQTLRMVPASPLTSTEIKKTQKTKQGLIQMPLPTLPRRKLLPSTNSNWRGAGSTPHRRSPSGLSAHPRASLSSYNSKI